MFLTVISVIIVMAGTFFATRYTYKSEIEALQNANQAKLERKIHSTKFSAWEEGYSAGRAYETTGDPKANPYQS